MTIEKKSPFAKIRAEVRLISEMVAPFIEALNQFSSEFGQGIFIYEVFKKLHTELAFQSSMGVDALSDLFAPEETGERRSDLTIFRKFVQEQKGHSKSF